MGDFDVKAILAGAAAAALMLTGSAQAVELLSNGDFEAGNNGFYSEYNYLTLNGYQTNLWPEGSYDVSNDPNADHYLFTSFADHTADPGKLMMVVNGSGTADKVVWAQGDIGGGTALLGAANTAYTFSFWLAKVYPSSPANLNLWVNGEKVDGVTFQNTAATGVWEQFSYTGVTGADGLQTIGLTNNNLEPSGNDFALDDMSLIGTAVPEPGAWALMIMGFGAMGSMLRSTRRRSAAATA